MATLQTIGSTGLAGTAPTPVLQHAINRYLVNDDLMNYGKSSTGSNVGTGGMNTKLIAAKIATKAGCDMIICNSKDIGILHGLMEGKNLGTLFISNKDDNFDLPDFVDKLHKD
jgi:glutamate 5-kinase